MSLNDARPVRSASLLMIVYTQVSEDTIRIISAREATRREEKMYIE
ncbi:MAG: BrnT family toxin [Chloracidobacterium sp.]|nr:BrnT family toxin [Chloracidobacterium sp.]